ncbi:X protein [adeno-associated virus 2]|uniref:X protein n=1 Tax=Adeno-associated virus 2 TaxID=10804 RepID=A0A077B0N8_AAV2|nr:X protein [adeno-associated virus 2]AIK97766.1 X protein [adeno-associated virus 2]
MVLYLPTSREATDKQLPQMSTHKAFFQAWSGRTEMCTFRGPSGQRFHTRTDIFTPLPSWVDSDLNTLLHRFSSRTPRYLRILRPPSVRQSLLPSSHSTPRDRSAWRSSGSCRRKTANAGIPKFSTLPTTTSLLMWTLLWTLMACIQSLAPLAPDT